MTPVAQEFRSCLAWWCWLRVSLDVVVKVLARTTFSWRLVWGRRCPFKPAHLHVVGRTLQVRALWPSRRGAWVSCWCARRLPWGRWSKGKSSVEAAVSFLLLLLNSFFWDTIYILKSPFVFSVQFNLFKYIKQPSPQSNFRTFHHFKKKLLTHFYWSLHILTTHSSVLGIC